MSEPETDSQRIVLAGDVPSPAKPPAGYPFHTVCAHAKPMCSVDKPVLADSQHRATACLRWRELPLPARLSAASARPPSQRPVLTYWMQSPWFLNARASARARFFQPLSLQALASVASVKALIWIAGT